MVDRWYVVEAYEGRDEEAALRLLRAGYRAWRPVHEVRSWVRERMASGRPRRMVTKHPRFGRYFFLRVDLAGETGEFREVAVRDTRGVLDFLRPAPDQRPSALPDDMVPYLRTHRPVRARPDEIARVNIGDLVRVAGGPLDGLEGLVEAVDIHGAVRVTLGLFGGPTPVTLEVGHVELLAQGRRPPMKLASKRCANPELAHMAQL